MINLVNIVEGRSASTEAEVNLKAKWKFFLQDLPLVRKQENVKWRV
jgi:hypothetical protein